MLTGKAAPLDLSGSLVSSSVEMVDLANHIKDALRKQTCVVIFHDSFNETNSETNSCYIYIAAIKQKW